MEVCDGFIVVRRNDEETPHRRVRASRRGDYENDKENDETIEIGRLEVSPGRGFVFHH